jgi:DNA-binding transcriptional MerR regulator
MQNHYDIQTAANYLKVPTTTLKFWRAHGTGPAFLKIGKRVYYTELDLLEYIESRRMKQFTRKAA